MAPKVATNPLRMRWSCGPDALHRRSCYERGWLVPLLSAARRSFTACQAADGR